MPVDKLTSLHQRLTDTVLGSEEASNLLLTSLLAKGHALIEGAPGLGKTSLAQSLASCFNGVFKRVQFTPDLLPSDILGYHLYRQHNGDFDFIQGPIFANLLLADEINRTSPRVQSALLEAMNESQVTIDGSTHQLEPPFMVIATQNDTSSTGTFPLPEPQLDRFLLSIPVSLPSSSIQKDILLGQHNKVITSPDLTAFLSPEDVISLQEKSSDVKISDSLANYIISLCETVRHLSANENAVSVRGSLALLRASQATALLHGSDHVLPEHVQYVFPHVMRHRIICDDGSSPELIIEQALQKTEVA